jgi:3'-phosphoadenosine 5'-phosphosulfate sulfotransferase (PAPS reductase)/FAD synthetase
VTRLRFPQVGAVTSGRWCSAALKIDVLDAVIRAQGRFLHSRTLVVTGERAEESRARAGYAAFERHRTDTRDGSRRPRWVDHWRPVHAWRSADVWAALRRWGVLPAPAYRLGFGRLSCLACIFGSADQWATVRWLAPDLFRCIAAYEGRFGCTIQRGRTITELADHGRPFAAALALPGLARRAMQPGWDEPVLAPSDL